MRFKIHSLIFIFIACFLLFSYTPIQGDMPEAKSKTCFRGDKVPPDQQQMIVEQLEALSKYYKDKEFGKIEQLYKETGVLTRHDLKVIEGGKKIATYFSELHKREVAEVKFTAECVYVQKLVGITIGDLLKKGIIQKRYIPVGVNNDRLVIHRLHAIISYSFELEGKKYNQGPGSGWDGWHIDGCPIF